MNLGDSRILRNLMKSWKKRGDNSATFLNDFAKKKEKKQLFESSDLNSMNITKSSETFQESANQLQHYQDVY